MRYRPCGLLERKWRSFACDVRECAKPLTLEISTAKAATMTDLYNQSDLEMLAADCLTRAGVSDAVARIVARDVGLSEAAGDSDHGIAALLRDIRLLRYGRLFGDAKVVVSRSAPSVLHVDGGHGFAASAMAKVIPAVIETANAQGVAIVHLSRASDAGVMAGAMADLAQAGLAGVAVRAGGDAVAIRPGSRQSVSLDTGARSMLQNFLALAPPAEDTPLGGPISLSAWLCTMNPDATGVATLIEHAPKVDVSPRTSGIAVAPDLMAQIVNA